METSSSTSDSEAGNSSSESLSSSGQRFPISIRGFLQYPISTLLEYSGVLRPHTLSTPESQSLLPPHIQNPSSDSFDSPNSNSNSNSSSSNNGEVSIRIIGDNTNNNSNNNDDDDDVEFGVGVGGEESGNGNVGGEEMVGGSSSSYQQQQGRYDIQQAARWLEQILPFSLLLFVVFIRQHLQGFFVTIYVTAILFKSNDILRKQTALKGERKILVLVGYSVFFMLHVFGIYWWLRGDDFFYPLLMIPPKAIPPFWHAIYIILVNDTMARQTAMVFKLGLLMYHKNGRGHNFRRQGQILTLVEYTVLLYRALLPAPVWYRFFLNKEYGSLFSSLTTGLYLTIKLTSMVEKVRSFYTALKALSKQDVHYGSYATSEQVNAAGDLCAICQEKMHTPILLRCKHIFCEDCVSEWFERERTCPLCRAVVRAADLRSYGDGSTSLFF